MRRERLFAAIEEVGEALRQSGLADAFAQLLLPAAAADLNKRRAAALGGLKSYVIAAERFSEPASELARILALEELEATELWLEVLALGESPERRLLEWRQKIGFVESILPRIASLFRPEPLRELMEPTGDEEPLFTDDALLTVLVIERDREHATPKRLIEVFESVTLLYQACAELEGVKAKGLTILACDSGIDKSFDFLGTERVVERVKEVLLSLWDSVVLHRGHKFADRGDRITRDLPVMQRVLELEQGGKLTAEQATALRRQLTDAATKFILGGAMIPEIEKLSYSPRELMAPASGLPCEVNGDAGKIVAETNQESLKLDNLSEHDQATLLRLLEQARGEVDEDSELGEVRAASPAAMLEAPDPSAS